MQDDEKLNLGTAEEQYWRVSGKKGTYVVRAQTEAEAEKMARTLKYDMFATGITKIEKVDEMTYIAVKVTELEKSVQHVGDIYGMVACLLIITIISTFIAIFLLV